MKRIDALKTLTGGDIEGVVVRIRDIKRDQCDWDAGELISIYEWLDEDLPEAAQKSSRSGETVEIRAEDPKPEKESKKRTKLDDAKMLALRKAGWSYAKIADEMGVAQQTVINHIQRME